MSLLNNVSRVSFASPILIDKIIGTYEGSFSLTAPAAGATNTVTTPKTTNINETTLFQGIFSVDGGVSWNPFQTRKNHVERTDASINPQGEVFVYGESIAGTFNIVAQNQRNLSSTFGTNYTLMYKVALIAKKTQGAITPQPIGSNKLFDSRLNYQKIAVDDVSPTSGVGQTVTVAHNLGYAPKVRVYSETSGGSLKSMGFSLSNSVSIGTANVSVFVPGSFTGNIHTRIYYDS